MTDFLAELTTLINRYSKENGSGTPDFLLAEFLDAQLRTFDQYVTRRERWYGRSDAPLSDSGAAPLPAPPEQGTDHG